jgi:hypothetical protein
MDNIINLINTFKKPEIEFLRNEEKFGFSFIQFENEYIELEIKQREDCLNLYIQGKIKELIKIKELLRDLSIELKSKIDGNNTIEIPILLEPHTFYYLFVIQLKYVNKLVEYIDSLSIIEKITPDEKPFKLSFKKIALIHVYDRKPITRQNAAEIAGKYGYKSKNSGEGLFHDYTTYSYSADRKGKPDTLLKLKNKIKLISSIIDLLSEKGKIEALNDINSLETNSEKIDDEKL